jgi:hypothetical protein
MVQDSVPVVGRHEIDECVAYRPGVMDVVRDKDDSNSCAIISQQAVDFSRMHLQGNALESSYFPEGFFDIF